MTSTPHGKATHALLDLNVERQGVKGHAALGTGGEPMTYSIVARDPLTGELGVAVQSRYFGAGSGVPWAEPGVGCIGCENSDSAPDQRFRGPAIWLRLGPDTCFVNIVWGE
jgi:Family of unknown function (DUF1028)